MTHLAASAHTPVASAHPHIDLPFPELLLQASSAPDWPTKKALIASLPDQPTRRLITAQRCPVTSWFMDIELTKRQGLPPAMRHLFGAYPQSKVVRLAADLHWLRQKHPAVTSKDPAWKALLAPSQAKDMGWHSAVHAQYTAVQEGGADLAHALQEALSLTATQSRELFYTTDAAILEARPTLSKKTLASWCRALYLSAERSPDRQGRYTPGKAAVRRAFMLCIHRLAGGNTAAAHRYWTLIYPDVELTRQAFDKQVREAIKQLWLSERPNAGRW